MSERVCKRCGGPLPTEHGNRRYCSENCRKRHWERAPENRPACVDCGAPTWRGTRCEGCHRVFAAARHEALLDRIAELYNAGVPLLAIGLALGRDVGHGGGPALGRDLDECRRTGRVGYRYKAYEDRAA